MIERKQMRVFVAINLPEPVLQFCAEIQNKMIDFLKQNDIAYRIIPKDRLHITLKAPVQVNQQQLERMIYALQKLTFEPIYLRTSDLFYNQRSDLIWLSIVDSEALQKLVAQINNALEFLEIENYAKQIHQFKGHITLIRSVQLNEFQLQELYKHMQGLIPMEFYSNAIVLKQSLLEKGHLVGYGDIMEFSS